MKRQTPQGFSKAQNLTISKEEKPSNTKLIQTPSASEAMSNSQASSSVREQADKSEGKNYF